MKSVLNWVLGSARATINLNAPHTIVRHDSLRNQCLSEVFGAQVDTIGRTLGDLELLYVKHNDGDFCYERGAGGVLTKQE